MQWKDLAAVLPQGLELTGKVIGGPIGAVAEMGGHLLASALGVEAKPDAVAAALQANPQAAADIVKAQLEHDAAMQQLAVQQTISLAVEQTKRLQVDAEDRDSARRRESALHDNTPKVLAYVVVGGYLIVQAFLLTSTVDPAMRDIVMRSLGTLDALVGMVASYYFGSSAGSRLKDVRDAVVARLSPSGGA